LDQNKEERKVNSCADRPDGGKERKLASTRFQAFLFWGQSGPGTSSGHRTNLGGVVSFGGVMRLDHRFSVRLDAQQYLFSSAFDDSYTPHLGTAPAPEHGSRLRHDFVLLAGFSWRCD
jgi:hypothetical protein